MLKRIMKRFSIIFVVLALCLSLCACGGPETIRSSDTLFEVVARYSDCSILRNKETNVLFLLILFSQSYFTFKIHLEITKLSKSLLAVFQDLCIENTLNNCN